MSGRCGVAAIAVLVALLSGCVAEAPRSAVGFGPGAFRPARDVLVVRYDDPPGDDELDDGYACGDASAAAFARGPHEWLPRPDPAGGYDGTNRSVCGRCGLRRRVWVERAAGCGEARAP